MKLKNSRRFLSLWLPRWPTDRLKRRDASFREGGPLVLYEAAKSALRIYAGDAEAEALGFYRGQPLADARATHRLVAMKADPAADAAEFLRIAEWLLRYSPHVGIFTAGDAVLDITGCAHLFGGEAALIEDALARFTHARIEGRAAIADSPGAAWALAHYGREPIIACGSARAALAGLPVAALRIEEEAGEGLRRLGLKRIGQLYDLPRAPLTARMGAHVLRRLAQALGDIDEPINPIRPAPEFSAEVRLVEPIASTDAILFCLEDMAPRLEAALTREGKGGRRFELALFRVDNHVARISVGTARPTRRPQAILRLFKDRLADIHNHQDAGFGYDLMRLSAFDCAVYEAAPAAFDRPQTDGDLADLVDRLANRLGPSRVCRIRLQNSHIPERSAVLVPAFSGNRDSGVGSRKPQTPRPVKLLVHPEPIDAMAEIPDGPPIRFRWRRISYAVKKASGPERIAGEWRHVEEPAPTRDYYRVEDDAGRRFWICREGFYGENAKWFLHGFFG